MNNLLKNVGIWLVIGLVVLTVVKQFDARQGPKDSVPYSEFMDRAKAGSVESATVEGRTIKWISADKKRFVTYSPGDIWMVGDLVKYGVKVEAKPEEEQSFLAQVFISWFPMLLLIGVWIFFMRQMQGGGRGGAFSFGKSKAKILDESNNTVTFADVVRSKDRQPFSTGHSLLGIFAHHPRVAQCLDQLLARQPIPEQRQQAWELIATNPHHVPPQGIPITLTITKARCCGSQPLEVLLLQ